MAGITQRKRGGRHGDPALGSMAELHRGKKGPFLTSVATGRSASVGEEMVDTVKRKAAALLGEAEEWHSEEGGDARRRVGPASSSRTAPASRRRRVRVLVPGSSPPLHSTDASDGEIGEESSSG
jgi:hypothetical protein